VQTDNLAGLEAPIQQNRLPDSDGPDPYDLESLIAPPSEDDEIGDAEQLEYPVRRPGEDFFRVHPDPAWQIEVFGYRSKSDRFSDWYVIHQSLRNDFPGKLSRVRFITACNIAQEIFVWPINVTTDGGRLNPWASSGLQAARAAEKEWVSVHGGNNSYMLRRAKRQDHREPAWPDMSPREFLGKALKPWVVESAEHHIVKRLLGLGS
jgi:hypothetical protein